MNRLFYGDNLAVLRESIADESVDLVYLDPPFNSNRSYNVLFKNKSGTDSQAQIEAFDDTWTWSQQSEEQYDQLVRYAPPRVAECVRALRGLVGPNDVLAYLVMMTSRLVELHRVLRSTGSLYLHCDPTASHYLKIVLDSIFDPRNFRGEIVWRRYGAHNDVKKNYAAVHDSILFYAKSPAATFTTQYLEHDPEYVERAYRHKDPDGRRWQSQNLASPNPRPNLTYPYTALNQETYEPHPNGWKVSPERMLELDQQGRLVYPSKPTGRLRVKNYLDEMKGPALGDLWADVPPLTGSNAERLGYPTQKPVALLERILAASSNPGDVILDPFCGCGTSIDAAQRMGRQWIGIDVTFLAVDLIEKRLKDTFYDHQISYDVRGIPEDLEGALSLFKANPFDFERWAVSLVDATPNERQVGDRGSDGVIRFPTDNRTGMGMGLVSVKGGKTVNPAMVRDLAGTIDHHRADLGVFVCMTKPTGGMLEVARHSGDYVWPVDGRRFPRLQISTIESLLAGQKPQMPTPILPYSRSRRLVSDQQYQFAL